MILDYLKKLDIFKNLINIDDYNCIKGSNEDGNCLIIMNIFNNIDKSIILCLPSLYEAQKYYDKLSFYLDNDCLFFPSDEYILNEMLISSDEFKFERLETIFSSFKNEKKVIVTNLSGLTRKLFSKEVYKENIINFEKGKNYDLNIIKTKLINMGYKKVFNVRKYGEFSIRGDILDFYSFLKDPIRIEFFGDEIEDIKIFSLDTQLSTSHVNSAIAYPMTEMVYDDKDIIEFKNNFLKFIDESNEIEKEKFLLDLDNIENRNSLNILNRYINFFNKEKSSIKDFFDSYLFLVDYNKIVSEQEKTFNDLNEYAIRNNSFKSLELKYFYNIFELLDKTHYIVFEGLTYHNSSKNKYFSCRNVNDYENNIKLFLEDINKKYLNSIVCYSYEDINKLNIIKEALREYDIYTHDASCYNFKKGVLNLINEKTLSFELVDESFYLINESKIFKNTNPFKIKYRSIKQEGKNISSIDDLKIGDYVVHYDHGIGRYMGIKTIKSMDILRDYIYLVYADDNALYIPIEQFKKLKKYVASESMVPKLTKLGTKQWENQKKKVKEKANDISEKLINLYSEREASKGFKFLKDTLEQKQFEQEFKFEETKDQLRIIDEVKKDMESSKPMDRLICGDVGYGKTEIALRACFKAIMSGKQVAYLAPTTVLSKQHFNTFIERFKNFGAEIKLLNRFTTKKEEKIILEDLKSGKIDCLIGTHRILSNDIIFKDLGLFIIDEEQRFGVKHKERIKEMKINVDTITLTATPIPRTLQMSIMGIKDLSMLETPPKNRYPVQTYVIKRNDQLIKEVIEKELARNGQVFYLYNRVEDIENIAFKIKSLVKDARVCYAHGKMDKNKLDLIIDSFVNHEFDVLVSTTIIETGIDIPNSNTLLIHDADMLGLSQLYQLRGRVGRSDKIAYAYLMYAPNKNLTDTAYKRLEVIKEFTELGSGFKIAMRDLNIRGAGDILGSDQSGFIDTVGLDLYLKILDETIKEKRGIKNITQEKTEIGQVLYSRHISKKLIENDDTRIEMHQKIDNLNSIEEMEELKKEFKDRFGKLSDDIILYMEEKLFKNILNKLNITKITYTSFEAIIYLNKELSSKIDPGKMFMIAQTISRNINFEYHDNSFTVKFHMLRSEKWMMDAIMFFSKLNNLLYKNN